MVTRRGFRSIRETFLERKRQEVRQELIHKVRQEVRQEVRQCNLESGNKVPLRTLTLLGS